MSKTMRMVMMVALVVVVIAAGVVVGCGNNEEENLQQVTIELSQYLRGSTGDLDDATLNSAAEGAGDGAVNTMFTAFTLPTVPPGTQYSNLTPAQQDAVQAAAAAFFDSVQAGIDADQDLTTNPAYVTLAELQGMTWLGLWAQAFTGYTPQDAFWKVMPDPAGRGSKVEYLDKLAKAAYNNKTYAQITADERGVLDQQVADFLAQMQTDVNAAIAAQVAAGTPVLFANMEAFLAASAAGDATGYPSQSQPWTIAFTAKLMNDYPDVYVQLAAAGQGAMMPIVKASEAFQVLKGPAVAPNGTYAAEAWKADVTAGVHPVQAFKRWMVKPALLGLTGFSTLVANALVEFDVLITNLNDYDVSIDSIDMNVSNNDNGFGLLQARDVDAAKLALHDAVWVPAKGNVDVHLVTSIKTLDVLTWLIVGPGLDSTTAGTYANSVWTKVKAGTAVWKVTLVTSQTSASGEQNIPDATYNLTWTPSTP